MRTTALLLTSIVLGFTGCSDDTSASDDASPTDDASQSIDAAPTPDATAYDAGPSPDAFQAAGVDLLFVIDNSGSMAEEQASLAQGMASFITSLEAANNGTLPSLQIGIVSTDLGGGPFGIANCTGNGDNGVLQSAPIGQCEAPNGAFISDLIGPDQQRVRNYTGALADVFSCIALLGTDGCGFEQPLEAMRRALDGTNAQNDGFRRPDALLAVVILSDEDDCSTADVNMFDTSQTQIDDPLGPLSSFRCFEFGVQCSPDDPRVAGPRTDCVSREDSQYMYPIQQYVDFLQTLAPGNVVVAAIQGNPTPVAVGSNFEGNPQLEPSCISGSGEASPGVRLAQFLGEFPGVNQIRSICDTLPSSLQSFAQLIASQL